MQINRFIDTVPGISELQKEFYKAYIHARFALILLPAWELAAAVE